MLGRETPLLREGALARGNTQLQDLGKQFQRACAGARSGSDSGQRAVEAREAARLAKRILWVCQEQGNAMRRAGPWFPLDALFSVTGTAQDEALRHLENIQINVAKTVHGNAAVNEAFERFSCEPSARPCSQERPREMQMHVWDQAQHAGEYGEILQKLEHVSELFTHVNEVILQGDELVEKVDDTVSEAAARLAEGERKILEHYTLHGAHSQVSCFVRALAKVAVFAMVVTFFVALSCQ